MTHDMKTYIQLKIQELEDKISKNSGSINELRMELNRLKMIEFEESIREEDNKQLLQE